MLIRTFFFVLGLLFSFLPQTVMSYTIDWSGLYRIEGVQIDNSELTKTKKDKSYINHHFILKPNMIVADGLQIHSRFDIFNSTANTQFGQLFGNGIGGANSDANTLSDRQTDDNIRVTQLYLTYDTEFMSVTVGRAPIAFGLGLTYSAGEGDFDHFFDNRDMISGRYVLGNLSFTTMLNKLNEGTLDLGDDVRELILQLDYENLDSETAFGLMWNWRRAGITGNDFPATTVVAAATAAAGFEGEFVNFYLKRGFGNFAFGFEGGFTGGNTGFKDASSADIELGGFGLALEMDYKASESKWAWDLKTGFASGDDPSTTNKFEGFFFDRNYDVAMLLFNHVVGQFDALSSTLSRNAVPANAGIVADLESISNVIYVAPGFRYQWKPKWAIESRLIYGTLSEKNVTINGATTAVDSSLGFELDTAIEFKPHERFTWINQIGLLFPGNTFKGGANNFDNEFTYGFMTKAAVRF